MRTLARAAAYTLLAAVVALSLTVTITTGIFWAVISCAAVASLVILTVEIRKALALTSPEALDALFDDDHTQQQVDRYHCAGHGCQLRTFYSDEGGTTWVCANCERSYWVPVADVPYDREKDGAA